jgi:phospholipase/carboxylesterase
MRRVTHPKTTILSAALCLALAACDSATELGSGPPDGKERLTARPAANVNSIAPGYYSLQVAAPKDANLLIPSTVPAGTQVPLIVMLHGAGGAQAPIDQMFALGEQYGAAVLAPQSRLNTWDVAIDGFGADVVVINKALEETFKRLRVDPTRIALAGFSDGASYALSLGLGNGDLFSHLIAFAPGFLSPAPRVGKPSIFIAHGREDTVLPIQNTVNNIVPFLRFLAYPVRFDEFEGGHRVDPAGADTVFHWFLR